MSVPSPYAAAASLKRADDTMQLHDLLIAVNEYIERLCVPREEALEQALRDAEETQ